MKSHSVQREMNPTEKYINNYSSDIYTYTNVFMLHKPQYLLTGERAWSSAAATRRDAGNFSREEIRPVWTANPGQVPP